jgi:uncharacterized protein YjiS (DUF1127 family)
MTDILSKDIHGGKGRANKAAPLWFKWLLLLEQDYRHRRALSVLSDETLQDVNISRAEIEAETREPRPGNSRSAGAALTPQNGSKRSDRVAAPR